VVPDESAQGLKNWLMVLIGGVHDALQRINTTEPQPNLVFVFVAEQLKPLRYLVADEYIMGGLLLLLKLHIGEARADEHRGTTQELADRLTKIVFDIGPRLCIANCKPQTMHLSLRKSPPKPPGKNQQSYGCDAGGQPRPPNSSGDSRGGEEPGPPGS
jgi:hypothetical protein